MICQDCRNAADATPPQPHTHQDHCVDGRRGKGVRDPGRWCYCQHAPAHWPTHNLLQALHRRWHCPVCGDLADPAVCPGYERSRIGASTLASGAVVAGSAPTRR